MIVPEMDVKNKQMTIFSIKRNHGGLTLAS